MRQDSTTAWADVTLTRLQDAFPEPVRTASAPAHRRQALYIAAGDCLYAVNANDGSARWGQQVKQTREFTYHPRISYPPPHRMGFAAPQVVNGIVYISMEGYGAYTCAFNADDGAPLWHTPTDGRVIAMPFLDLAAPLVGDGVVYAGTYALNAQDGTVLWRTSIEYSVEGTLALQALVGDTLYAATHMGVCAIDVRDGHIRWRRHPDKYTHVSGASIVSDGLLYTGLSGAIGYEKQSCSYALDTATGAEVWRYAMGDYIGAVIHDETIYITSGSRCLYALDKRNGALRWVRQLGSPARGSAAFADGKLYISADGVYALNSEDGAPLWYRNLEYDRSVSFSPPVVLDGAVYVARIDRRGRGTLYALAAHDGSEYWRIAYPSAIRPPAVVR